MHHHIWLYVGIILVIGFFETPSHPEPRRNIHRVIVRARGVRIYHNKPGEN